MPQYEGLRLFNLSPAQRQEAERRIQELERTSMHAQQDAEKQWLTKVDSLANSFDAFNSSHDNKDVKGMRTALQSMKTACMDLDATVSDVFAPPIQPSQMDLDHR